MVARIHTVAFQGIEVLPIEVQVQMAPGLPSFVMFGSIKRRLISAGCLIRSLGVFLVFLVIPVGGSHAQDAASSTRASLQHVLVELSKHSDGFSIDGSPESTRLLKAEWSILEQWTTSYLRSHATVSAAELEIAVKAVADGFGVTAVALDHKAILVSVTQGEIGTVFLEADRGAGFEAVWRIADSGEVAPKGFEPLGAWSPVRATSDCRTHPNGGACGPVYADLGKLADDIHGNRRFYVIGTYAQAMGATVGAQLTIWSWSGRESVPLFVKLYTYMDDQKWFVRRDDSTLHINVKQWFKSFYACGSCEGRQVDWTIAILPDRIQDLGERSMTPELDLVDALFTELLDGHSTANLAEPSVAAALQAKVDAARAEAVAGHYPPNMGMLLSWKAMTQGDRKTLCMGTDDAGTFEFEIAGGLDHPRIANVKGLGDDDCGE
ncbi:MAG TPA: hypothetical protein VGV37_04055 [Aliidongia sp.]|uniref:hypothetical protein n=1 Tax=Aliidongia sp. TaxID=1914230 RepID=UPI002DDD67BD|nr:hypothetical protein [Aliidongia sp.]HEV2673689.1 hypothetical protein [Aliidongia sp.]